MNHYSRRLILSPTSSRDSVVQATTSNGRGHYGTALGSKHRQWYWREVKETEIPLDGSSMQVTQFDRHTNTRVSWDTNGSIDGVEPGSKHPTDQNVGKHHSRRHV